MLKLRVTITGIAGFVDKFKRVVIPDASVARVSRNNPGVSIPAHFAYVRFNKDNIKKDANGFKRPIACVYKKPRRGDMSAVTPIDSVVGFLKNRRIVVASRVTSAHSANMKRPQNDELPHPDTDERKSLHWLSRVDAALGSAGEMDAIYRSDMPPLNVAAFMKLDQAHVETGYMFEDRKFSFQPNTTNYRRALSIGVDAVFDIDPAETEVKLDFVSFNPEDAGTISVVLVPETGANDIDIVIGNAPLDSILQVGHRHECVSGMPNYDFELFYDLSRKRPTTIWPIPVCEPVVGKPKDLGSENCPPATFLP